MTRGRLLLGVAAAVALLAAAALTVGRARLPRPATAAAAAATANARVASLVQGVDPGTALGAVPAPEAGLGLEDQFGQPRTLGDFHGRVVLLSFLDPNCTGLCPLTVQTLRDVRQLLGKAAAQLALVAVDANPQALSVGDIRQSSTREGMLHGWTYLTGSLAELRGVWNAYHIETAILRGKDHYTAATYVIDQQGREQQLYLTGSDPANVPAQAYVIAQEVARLLPGHVRIASPKALVGAPSGVLAVAAGPFQLAGIGPSGGAVTVRAGAGRTLLVDFFATWCHACRQDLAILNRYAGEQHAAGSGLPPVVGVDIRIAEPSTAYVRHFLADAHVAFPVGLDGRGTVMDAYGVTALPTMVLVDPDGQVLWRHLGALSLPTLLSDVHAALPAGHPGT